MDSGWMGAWDAYGRPLPHPTTFPSGMPSLVTYIHNNGQKAGIYWIPGVQQSQVNKPILGTPYYLRDILVNPWKPGNAFSFGQANPWHIKIDFTKPGAQEYVNSVVNLFAAWGFDFIKVDGVTPGSDHNDLGIDNREDVRAWSKAVAESGRPMWLTISWALDHKYASLWKEFSNARRIHQVVSCYCGKAIDWTAVARLFPRLATWQNDASPTQGWNDLDALLVGNSQNGLSDDERQTTMTLWALANSPLYMGDDLTNLDAFGLSLLTNDAVIAVDQSGNPAKRVTSGTQQVWSARNSDGTYTVGLFNLGADSAPVTVNWDSLGFSGTADVHDLWSNADLGTYTDAFTADLSTHASRLLKVTPR